MKSLVSLSACVVFAVALTAGCGGSGGQGKSSGLVKVGGIAPYQVTSTAGCAWTVNISYSTQFSGTGWIVTYTGVDSKGNANGPVVTDNAPTIQKGALVSTALGGGDNIQFYKIVITNSSGSTNLPNNGLAGYINYSGSIGC